MTSQVMQQPVISIKEKIEPRIYAYITPRNEDTKSYVKIGYTERSADERIKEQTKGVYAKKLWDYPAKYIAGEESYFMDHAFHNFLTKNGIKRKKIHGSTEWFDFGGDVDKAEKLFIAFTYRKSVDDLANGESVDSYVLRKEQEKAVSQTLAYFDDNPSGEFLWNAKPRFGKTLSAYDLVKRMGAKSVLILTNRPAVGDSWVNDYEQFIKNDKVIADYKFVSDSPAIKSRNILTREEYISNYVVPKEHEFHINFVSLQDLKGAKVFGGDHEKLRWITGIHWDLVIIDESHEAVDTGKTQFALNKIDKDYILHLSGTPFKQLASDEFTPDQIFNWTYMDEQEAKAEWDDEEGHNPYDELPALSMYTYQMSRMIVDEIKEGADIGLGENVDYAFDLNEFFSTDKSGKFIHEDDVIKWLDTLTTNKRYPYSTEELRGKLKHTMWFLQRVDSARALAKLLQEHEVFKDYAIVSVAGDGNIEKIVDEDMVDGLIEAEGKDEETIDGRNTALERVRKAIKENDKTITLSVGQLTTGVTIPEWTAVFMLNNVKSPALYMQAAFRAQNPYSWDEQVKDSLGNVITTRYRKQNAYVFDFSPERTLDIVDEFANNLQQETSDGGGTEGKRRENIKRLLNFFPVIGEDEEGIMVELSPEQVITLPSQFKSREVVRRGFMSNLLFANISRIFQNPEVLEIVNGFKKAETGRDMGKEDRVDRGKLEDVKVDAEGNVEVDEKEVHEKAGSLFSEKIFEVITLTDQGESDEPVGERVTKAVMENIKKGSEHFRDEYGLTRTEQNSRNKVSEKLVEELSEDVEREFKSSRSELEFTIEELYKDVKTEEDKELIKEMEKEEIEKFKKKQEEYLNKKVKEIHEEVAKQTVHTEEVDKETKKKDSVEDDVRANLRGFSRAIPSFIMAYGDEELCLDNFDNYVSDKVFKDVTGVTLEDFIFLRDGGSYTNDAGEEVTFEGGLFNEVVFDESIKGFLEKREELANYFEMHEEDIFDYIPPQETNQIYTPKRVVQMMVDALEEENPGIYDDSAKTFIDIYMKSGLYITEIVKRLYNSDIIKEELPNDEERIKHILENQVYGLAPSEIIYQISTNFIFANFDDEISRDNFKSVDVTPDVKEGKLQEKIDELFGEFESEAGKLRNSLGVRIV